MRRPRAAEFRRVFGRFRTVCQNAAIHRLTYVRRVIPRFFHTKGRAGRVASPVQLLLSDAADLGTKSLQSAAGHRVRLHLGA